MGQEFTTQIHRSGSGLVGVCSCRRRQTNPVETRVEAEDWCREHQAEHDRARAGLLKPLSDGRYLEYLREQEAGATNARDRAMWKQLADEFEPRVKGKGASEGDVPLFG